MTKRAIDDRRSKDILRALMDPSRPDMVRWSSSDLRVMLEHQLAAPLAAELDRFVEITCRSHEEVSSIIGSLRSHTFGELLHDSLPSIEAVQIVKDYAKASLVEDGDLPRDVARVLYVTAILTARRVGVEDISSLDDVSLERETRRCLTFGWLPSGVRDLLRTSLPGSDLG